MKYKIIRQPIFGITHIIIFVLLCAISLWLITDKNAVISHLLEAKEEKYVLLFLLAIVLFFMLAQMLTMEDCYSLKFKHKIMYFTGISLIIVSLICSYYFKNYFLIIPWIVGVIIFTYIIVFIIRNRKGIRCLKIPINDFLKIKCDKDFERYSIIMAISQIAYFVAAIIIFEERKFIGLTNILLLTFGVVLVITQAFKTYRIADYIIIDKKKRYAYNIVSPLLGLGMVFYINNVLILPITNIVMVVFCVAIIIITTISSDIEIYHKYVKHLLKRI